ncbi:MAG: PP2C family protein-serine/threonine phosphatase [Desulfobacterales bacterium]|nr:MAG: PP2C family protein-serine/threonine phosphatase [Desulfobacterales bacterium]
MDLNNSRETFRSRFDSWIFRLSNAASLPSDTDEKRLRKAVLILLAGICTTLGLIWGVGYFILGRPLAGSFPLGYSVISTFSLLYFFRSKGYKFFCRGQLALILIFPVLLQWSLGGFAASGAVIIWSILSPIGALMFAGTKGAIPWFTFYVLLMVISGALDHGSSSSQPSLPAFIMVISFVLNIGGVTAIAFFLLKYFVYAREQAMAALAREHQRVRQSLSLAMEVQQSLLPQDNPQAAGLDIAGSSIYCDETGGDYYDYLRAGGAADGKIGVVVGDVSDHGIPSALLMATVRARLRQRYSQSGGIEQVVSDVNRQLTEDVQDSGRFMTLFIAELDRKNNQLRWLNAGHEPAVVYDPRTNEFEALAGSGSLPLGVMANIFYKAGSRKIKSDQIIAIATDGIFEAQNPQGEMFGRKRFYDVIAQSASGTAATIMEAVLKAVKNFRQGLPPKDDLTLVIIKIQPSN